MGAFYKHCPEVETEHHGNCDGDMMNDHQLSISSDVAAFELLCQEVQDISPAIMAHKLKFQMQPQPFIVLMLDGCMFVEDLYDCEVIKPPDERCNTGPPLRSNSLRAPPIA